MHVRRSGLEVGKGELFKRLRLHEEQCTVPLLEENNYFKRKMEEEKKREKKKEKEGKGRERQRKYLRKLHCDCLLLYNKSLQNKVA